MIYFLYLLMLCPETVLKEYWGYDGFRKPQREVINFLLEGKDVFAMLPTGAGKSLCYQIPALCLQGFALIISPLVSLIEDQVNRLNILGISSVGVHSGLKKEAIEDIYKQISEGKYKLVYVSPERVQTLFFQDYIEFFEISLIAIDEAHCISQWGHDFRPAYRGLSVLKSYCPDVPVLALTASATQKVKDDIIEQLFLQNAIKFEQSIVRNNLFYHIKYTENKPEDCIKAFEKVKGSSILYCGSRMRTEQTAKMLEDNLNVPIHYYHAGLIKKERTYLQTQWTAAHNGVMTATTAFGMGIDKPDVRLVGHYDVPESIEQYYQEAGRAGRDGKNSFSILLYNTLDINKLENLPDVKYPQISFLISIYGLLCDYLKISVGDGMDNTYAFNIVDFSKYAKSPIITLVNVIKIFEKQGIVLWNNDVNTQYKVRLTTTRTNIEYLKKNEFQLFEVLEILLRTYGSVYNFDTPIQIFELSKRLGIDKTLFEKRLLQLEQLGILIYQPAIVGSHLIFLKERVPDRYLNLNVALIEELKMALQEKTSSMIAYLQDTVTCRNILLSQYFGQHMEEECGGCDNCLKKQKQLLNNGSNIYDNIIDILKSNKTILVADLVDNLSQYDKNDLLQVLRNMIDHQKIKYENNCISIL